MVGIRSWGAEIFVDFEHGESPRAFWLHQPPFFEFQTPRPGTCGDRRELDFAPLHESREGPPETPQSPALEANCFLEETLWRLRILEVPESNDDTAECRRKTGDGGDDAEEVGRQLLQQAPLKMARQTGPWPSWCAAQSGKGWRLQMCGAEARTTARTVMPEKMGCC